MHCVNCIIAKKGDFAEKLAAEGLCFSEHNGYLAIVPLPDARIELETHGVLALLRLGCPEMVLVETDSMDPECENARYISNDESESMNGIGCVYPMLKKMGVEVSGDQSVWQVVGLDKYRRYEDVVPQGVMEAYQAKLEQERKAREDAEYQQFVSEIAGKEAEALAEFLGSVGSYWPSNQCEQRQRAPLFARWVRENLK